MSNTQQSKNDISIKRRKEKQKLNSRDWVMEYVQTRPKPCQVDQTDMYLHQMADQQDQPGARLQTGTLGKLKGPGDYGKGLEEGKK